MNDEKSVEVTSVVWGRSRDRMLIELCEGIARVNLN